MEQLVYVDHGALYHKVQIEIERIPPPPTHTHTHVFEPSTTAAILRPYCSVIRVHPKMVARLDLAVFKLTAWTTRPERIPEIRIIAIPEPEDDMLPLPMRHTPCPLANNAAPARFPAAVSTTNTAILTIKQ